MHGGKGDVLFYRVLARHLNQDHPIYAFHLLERDIRQLGGFSIEGLASRYVAELLAERPDGPYVLIGFSFGGLVALEMAKRLHAQGSRVVLLRCSRARPRAHARLKRYLAALSEAASSQSSLDAIRRISGRLKGAFTRAADRIRDKITERSFKSIPVANGGILPFGS